MDFGNQTAENTDVLSSMLHKVGIGSTEGSPINQTGSSPLDLLVQCVDQTIEIPLKNILVKIMMSLPEKKAPLFELNKVGSSYQTSVVLNVSGTRFRVGEQIVTAPKVFGDVCTLPCESSISAVQKAFEYLEKKHLIQVVDYSSNVAENYENKRVFGDLNECSYAIEKIISEWSMVIDTFGKFRSDIERKQMLETVHGMKSSAGEVYYKANNFVETMLKITIEKHRAVYLEWREYEGERLRHLNFCNDKTTAYNLKGPRQPVYFNGKDVLEYVLEFLGLQKPEYSNEALVKSGLFRGEVLIQLPEVEEARCGGRTTFHGADLFTAADAEEDACAKALHYLERKLKITVVDKNYADRVEAKDNHLYRTRLLGKFLVIAEKIKKQWGCMIEYMDFIVDLFPDNTYNSVPLSSEQISARKICFEGLQSASEECTRRYKGVSDKIKDLDKYYAKVSKLEAM